MAFNYYEGWSEQQLLALRRELQAQLAAGRPTEVRLAGNTVRTDGADARAVEVSLERIAYALWCLYDAGETETVYKNPYDYHSGVTLQRFG